MNQKFEETERNKSTSILKKVITKHPLTVFFILSFLLIILFVLIRVILFLFGYFEVIEFVLQLFTVTTPTFAAIIVSYVLGGWTEVKKTFQGFTKWKVNWIWYFFGFLLILAPLLYAIIYNLATNSPLYFAQGYTIPAFIIQCIFLLIRGPLSEEPGWRGFALPRLESRFTALTSSIILGLIWAFWHLPMYFVET
ncbi:MAG: lysostaphin resistance A-like protein, partial [Candidatus Lokiarchaeota archaeon]